MNNVYIDKLISLIKQNLLTVEDIKNSDYKAEVEKRLTAS